MDLSRSEYDHLIEEWIFNERDRAIMRRRILDGITYDKLAHATKNVGKIIEMKEEEEYSNRGSYGMSNRGSYADGSYTDGSFDSSFARGRGRNARRDSMGRYASDYSRNDEMIHELHALANSLPANKREEVERLARRMEQM